jgi:hypothetical protein
MSTPVLRMHGRDSAAPTMLSPVLATGQGHHNSEQLWRKKSLSHPRVTASIREAVSAPGRVNIRIKQGYRPRYYL